MTFRIDRRTVLKSAAATIALPLLDAMGWAGDGTGASPVKPPARFVSMNFGLGVPLPPPGHGHRDAWSWFPTKTGRDYALSEIHRALVPFRDQMTFVSGMDHHLARISDGHSCTAQWLTGARPYGKNSISIDGLIADRTAQEVFQPSLVLTSSPAAGSTVAPPARTFDARGQAVPAQCDPRKTFELLFGRDAKSIERQRALYVQERSVLDLALMQTKALHVQLGSADRQRLDQHLEAIRESEKNLIRAESWLDKPRPTVDAKIDAWPSGTSTCKDRAQLERYFANHIETIVLAFATDSSRTAQFTLQPEVGHNEHISKLCGVLDTHGLSHDSGNPDYYKNWGIWCQCMSDQVGLLAKRLSELKEGDGSVLDNTIILFGSQCSDVHWNRNYPTLLIGGTKLGLKHGRHLRYPDGNLGNLFATLLTCYGIDEPKFANADGKVADLLTA
ncbi:hypothetical protein LBMAG53_20110 [Planctomycetota bacterium]|nr:hypothetical protein LBMAG53_20110 [Planctomycetota bacterium]